LHSKTLNANIDFASTPFVVQQELAPWRRPVLEVDGVAREYPRIAGISSFGAGGANAHLVIEEYIEPAGTAPVASAPEADGPALVVLSARDEGRLQEQVRLLLAAVTAVADMSLTDLAYTLQIGREAMEERLGLIVDSLEDLRVKLRAIAAGDQEEVGK